MTYLKGVSNGAWNAGGNLHKNAAVFQQREREQP